MEIVYIGLAKLITTAFHFILVTVGNMGVSFGIKTFAQVERIKMIVIKTLETLPEHCYDCPCHNGENGYCKADDLERNSDWRPFWCPLEEVKDSWVKMLEDCMR